MNSKEEDIPYEVQDHKGYNFVTKQVTLDEEEYEKLINVYILHQRTVEFVRKMAIYV